MKIFKLPDLGEGLPDAEIAEWHVKVGDIVKIDQRLVSMETAKAVVEVPSPVEGRIKKLYGDTGDIIQTGLPLVEFEIEEEKKSDKTLDVEENTAATVAGKIQVGNTIVQEQATVIVSAGPQHSIKATPVIRALAQRLKVNLATVSPTGPNGTLTTKDVEQAALALQEAGPLEDLKGVRRVMAYSMSQSHIEVVPVTIMEDAKLANWSPNEDITVRLIQAIVTACKQEPALNAWYDSKAIGRRLLPEVHLGLAMDTADGLFVPVIRTEEYKTIPALRKKINELKEQVSNRTIAAQELRGVSFTLSNFGKFAGRYANPIVVPPTVGILGVGKIREEAVVINREIRISKVLPLALTFDHRAVTGGEATRFLGVLIEELEK